MYLRKLFLLPLVFMWIWLPALVCLISVTVPDGAKAATMANHDHQIYFADCPEPRRRPVDPIRLAC